MHSCKEVKGGGNARLINAIAILKLVNGLWSSLNGVTAVYVNTILSIQQNSMQL
jgi:hypothetical protein